MTLEELLNNLEEQISYLSNTIKIPGMDSNDIKQELRLNIIETLNKIPEPDREKYEKGWWFKRMKWFLLNLANKEKKEPINRSIRIDRLDGK